MECAYYFDFCQLCLTSVSLDLHRPPGQSSGLCGSFFVRVGDFCVRLLFSDLSSQLIDPVPLLGFNLLFLDVRLQQRLQSLSQLRRQSNQATHRYKKYDSPDDPLNWYFAVHGQCLGRHPSLVIS